MDTLITVADVKSGNLEPLILQTAQRVFSKIEAYNKGVDSLDTARSILANVKAKFDKPGYAAFLEKYFPGLSTSEKYKKLEVFDGKKSIEDLRERNREDQRKHREKLAKEKADREAKLAAQAAEIARLKAEKEAAEKLKTGQADATLIKKDGTKHPDPAAPLATDFAEAEKSPADNDNKAAETNVFGDKVETLVDGEDGDQPKISLTEAARCLPDCSPKSPKYTPPTVPTLPDATWFYDLTPEAAFIRACHELVKREFTPVDLFGLACKTMASMMNELTWQDAIKKHATKKTRADVVAEQEERSKAA